MQSGQKIRDYVLAERIGTGGMGEVWRALHTTLQRQVAIKAMDPHLANDSESEQRFVREARAQAALHHPRILQVTDFFSEGGVYYLVMPLVDGVSLEKRLTRSRGPLPLAEAVLIARDVLEGLDYAHKNGVIHRDIKPSNILLDASGHAFLLDFGIALLIGQDRRTHTGASLGTPHYMSPEQIQHPKKIDHRSDVYSAGCVIYEMLAGRPPFCVPDEDEDSLFAIQQAHVRQTPEPVRRWNPSVPPLIDKAILRALAKDPAQRWNGCGEFLRALEAHRGDTILEDPPRPPSPAPAGQGKSPLFWILSSVAGCLALAVLAAVLLTANKKEDKPDPSTARPESSSPSFDCRRARLDVERMICADAEIARLDVEMADLYHKLYGHEKHLRPEQLRWLQQERNICQTNECLVQVYRERIAEFRRRSS
ncbi:MAG TPA: protein kinase [Thermoanaerobaculia bacterium]|nr:protein kinase [Thermoanaerobaculia bacterium]